MLSQQAWTGEHLANPEYDRWAQLDKVAFNKLRVKRQREERNGVLLKDRTSCALPNGGLIKRSHKIGGLKERLLQRGFQEFEDLPM